MHFECISFVVLPLMYTFYRVDSIDNGSTKFLAKNAEKGKVPKKSRHFVNLAEKAKKAKRQKFDPYS